MNASTPNNQPVEHGLYVYGVVSATTDDLEIDVDPMTADGRIEAKQAGELVAICERMPLEPWTGPESTQNLQTLEWVAPRAVLHETVNELVGRQMPIFPMTFGTLFSSHDALRDHLEERSSELMAYLDRICGRSEWALKGLLDRAAAQTYLTETAAPEPENGLAYLKQKKQKAQTRMQIEPWLDEIGADLYEALGEMTVDQTVLTGRGRSAAEDGRAVVFNWALLVENTAESRLAEFIDAWNASHADTGLQLDLSGPWPAYSFRTTAEQ